MGSRFYIDIEQAKARISEIELANAARELNISPGALANRVSGKTKNPEKLDMEICQPPHSCFECPYSDCIRNGRRFITSPTKEEVEFIHNSGIFKYGGNLNAETC